MATVLFVCRQNAGRSQMSQALFTHAAGGAHHALSAGTTPADHVHPEVVQVMRELDIDLSDRIPQRLTRELAEQADVVVTMGCGDQCPVIPGKRYLDWALPDPAGKPIDEVRRTRDEIRRRVEDLLTQFRKHHQDQGAPMSITEQPAKTKPTAVRPSARVGVTRGKVASTNQR